MRWCVYVAKLKRVRPVAGLVDTVAYNSRRTVVKVEGIPMGYYCSVIEKMETNRDGILRTVKRDDEVYSTSSSCCIIYYPQLTKFTAGRGYGGDSG